MKKILSALLSILMAFSAFSVMPFSAFAEETYNVWANGLQFTSDNLSVTCGDGTAVFTPETNTLTLTNASVSASYEFKPWYEAMIYSELSELNIVLEGTNVLESTNTYADGIDSAGGCNIIISGSGSLAINNAYYGMYIGDWETAGGDLTVKGGATLTVTNSKCASIWVNHDINFLDCNVTVNKTSTNYDGIVSNTDGTFTVNGATLNVTNYHSAIHFGNGDETNHAFVVEAGEINLTSTDDCAITVEPVYESDPKDYRGTVTINGGRLTVNSSMGGITLEDEKITLGTKMAYIKGTSLTETGEVIIGVDAVTVTKENFLDYFTAEGVLKPTEKPALIFKGDFDGLDVSEITINQSVEITSDNAVFSGASFKITADNVSVDGLDITQTGEYAIKVDNASGVSITNNKVTFTGDRDKGEVRRALLVNGSAETPISTVTVKDNTFDISLASETVMWQENPVGSGNWVGVAPSEGIQFLNCNEVNFISNIVDVKTTEVVGGYDTVYAVASDNSDSANATFNANGNAVSVTGKTYAYGFSTSTKKSIITENKVNCKADYYASAVDVNINGAGFSAQVVLNKLSADAEMVYGINYNSNSSGNSDIAAVENEIDMKGHFCLGVRFNESAGTKEKSVTALNNTITAEGDYLVGISALGAGSNAVVNNSVNVMGTNTGSTTFWENAFNRDYGSCGVYVDGNGVITSNTITSSDIGVISRGGATIPSNTIATGGEYTVDIGDTNATVVGNTLNAKTRYGDDSIKQTAGELHDNTHAHLLTRVSAIAATPEKEGNTEYYVCSYCGDYFADAEGKTPITDKNSVIIPKLDPDTPVISPEDAALPTEEATEELIKKTNTDKKDVAGSSYAPLKLKATTKAKTVTIKWKAISSADGYIIYGAPCGSKLTRLATVTNAKTVKKTFKKLKKGKYYKYVVVAYKTAADGSNRVISKSKSVHCATPGGKKGNPTGIKLKKTKITLKKGKKTKIKATLLKKGKVATHIAKFRYESSNKKIATVDKNGNIKAKKKGTVTIYVYTQSGICKTVKVKVK